MLHKPFKRRLASCLCAMLAAACVLSSLPVGAISGSDAGYAASAAAEETVNWALGKSYESDIQNYHSNNDPQLIKLTDGVYCAGYDSDGGNLVGFSDDQAVTFTFDLEKVRDITQIVVSGYDKNEYSIHNPETITVEYYDAESDSWVAAGSEDFGRSHTGLEGDEEGNYRLAVDVSFSAQMVRVTMRKDTGAITGDVGAAWCMLDEIEILGAASSDVAEIPLITTNLPSEKTIRVGESIELFVEAEGNGELTYQWYQDGAIIDGAVDSTYYVESAETFDSGVYTVVVTNTVGDTFESTTSVACTLNVRDIQSQNLLAGIPFTTSMKYGDPNAENQEDFPEFSGSEGNYINNSDDHIATELLTNGVRADNYDAMSDESARFNKRFNDIMYADFTFDLGSVKDFAQLNISCLGDSPNAIVMPTRLQVLTSNDEGDIKNWEIIYDSTLDNQFEHKEYVIATEDGDTVSARYVKLNLFFGDHTWIAMDEIELYDATTGDIPDGIIGTIGDDTPEDESNNIARGKSYTVNVSASDDADLTKLTDGVAGAVDATGGYSNWVNFPRSEESNNTEIIIDLEEESTFEQIEANFLHQADVGIVYPEWMRVEYSNDQSSWTLFGEEEIPSYSGTPNIFNLQMVGEKATARYIKVTLPALHWVFVDEIKVLQQRTVIDEGETEIDNYDTNNIAYGCTYTPAWAERDAYKDNGTKLTDGRRGPMKYSAPEWVGYHGTDGGDLGPEDFYITVDLGEVKTFEQVKFGTLKEGAAGIPYAISAQVETSVDGSSWTSYDRESLDFGMTNGVGRYVFTADEPISARYVKVNIGIDGSWLFVDEIEVLAQKDTREDANVNPDNGIEFNLVRGYTNYSVSRTPDMNNRPGILTDGKYMTLGSQYDRAWMGFQSNGESANDHVAITFDLYAPASISQIIVSSKYDLANNQTIPQNLKIYTSHDKTNWYLLKEFGNSDLPASGEAVKMVWDGKVDPFMSVLEGADMVSAAYVRLEFDVPSDADMYAVIDEVKIMGKLGTCSTAGSLIEVGEDGSYNVAAGKTYEVWPEAVEYLNYSDPTGAKLTDGIVATPDYSDSGWVGYHQFDNVKGGADGAQDLRWPNKSIVIDLGEVKSITSISYNLLYQGGAGITHPWAGRTFVSMDGDTWVEVGRTTVQGGPWRDDDGSYAYGWRTDKPNAMGAFDLVEDIDMIGARYVRVDIELFGWNFIDEISVMGFDGLVEGATPADFGHKLEDGHNYRRVDEGTD